MLKASIFVAIFAYAALFAFTGLGEAEAAPAGDPLFGLATLGATATKTVKDIADYIFKLITGSYDFSDSVAGMLSLLSDGIAKSFVSINNMNNENNNDSPNVNTAPTSTATSTTENLDE
uniref:Uncharacterized protein n=1 Tax=Coptotermes formosanus TaxID=36987 RepID=R4UP58_COPFO|nr:hypothetical protein [Coptotermes formosanus]